MKALKKIMLVALVVVAFATIACNKKAEEVAPAVDTTAVQTTVDTTVTDTTAAAPVAQ